MIGIGFAHAGPDTKVKTMASVLGLVCASPVPVMLLTEQGCYVEWNRIKLVKQAQAHHCSHILFVDADMEFEPYALAKLLAHKQPIVGAAYNMKVPPYCSTAKTHGTTGPTGETSAETLPTVPFDCWAVGTGLCLVDMGVFDTLPTPWFQQVFDAEGTLIYGDDTWFCKHARAHGFPVWCDPTIQVGHIGDQVF